MNDNDKLRQSIKSYYDTQLAFAETARQCDTAEKAYEEAKAKLAQVIYNTGGKAVILGGRRFRIITNGTDPSFKPWLSVEPCDDQFLD